MIVLARLLAPGDFGIVGMAGIFSGLAAAVNDLGFSAAVIQRKDIREGHLSTSFWAGLGMGAALCLLVLGASPPAAAFFKNPLVQPVMAVSSLGFIIGPLGTVHTALLARNLQFNKLAVVEVAGVVSYGITSIVMAWAGFGVWSIVWGGIAGIAASAVFTWAVCPWRPSLTFRRDSFTDLLEFGRNAAAFNLVNYAAANIDYLFVGRYLGAAALGYYTLAYKLMDFPREKLASIVTRVAFPAFSVIQDDNRRLQTAYLKTIAGISLVSFPLLTGMALVAPDFVRIIYGPKWISAVLPLQIMCLAGILYSIGTTAGSVIFSKGRPDIALKLSLLRVCLLGVFSFVGVGYGIAGVAAGVTFYASATLLVSLFVIRHLIGLTVGRYLLTLRPATIGSLVMASTLFIFRSILTRMYAPSDYILLVGSVSVGFVAYSLMIRASKGEAVDDLALLFRQTARPALKRAVSRLWAARKARRVHTEV